jgi:UDP-N-acetylmuramoyl-tripeptide--D-alanyl-D-alanine ligase
LFGLLDLARAPANRGHLGRLFERMGAEGPAQHAALAPDAAQNSDLVFCCGPLSKYLFDALPAHQRGGHFPDSAALAPALRAALQPGDAVLVKGSLGSRMSLVIAALLAGDQVS